MTTFQLYSRAWRDREGSTYEDRIEACAAARGLAMDLGAEVSVIEIGAHGERRIVATYFGD